MSKIDEDLKMQKITKLLEKGGTMLAQSHDCGAPMFRFQGKVLCPVCDPGIEQEKKLAQEQKLAQKPDVIKKQFQKDNGQEDPFRIQDNGQIQDNGHYIGQIAAMTKKNIQVIAESLENETDLLRIKEKLECIELGIKILKLLGNH